MDHAQVQPKPGQQSRPYRHASPGHVLPFLSNIDVTGHFLHEKAAPGQQLTCPGLTSNVPVIWLEDGVPPSTLALLSAVEGQL